MKQMVMFVLAAAVVFCSFAAADESSKPFSCGFEKADAGTVPSCWKIAETNGADKLAEWKIVELPDAPQGEKVFALSMTENIKRTYNLAIAEKTSFKDVEISVKVKSGTGEEDQGGGPIWRAQDEKNYYIARWNPLEDNYRVYYVKDSARKQIASINIKCDPKKWHDIKIVMIGNTIRAYLDGRLKMETHDDTFTEAGMIGLWTKADAATYFDQIEAKEFKKASDTVSKK